MTLYYLLNAPSKAVIHVWTVLVLVLCIAKTISAASAKNRRYIAVFAVGSVLWYMIFQIEHDLQLYGPENSSVGLCRALGILPHMYWTAALLLLTAFSVWLTVKMTKAEKKRINPNSIKLAVDRMPFGMCCYKSNGHVILSNMHMEDLCFSVTGRPLMNGHEFSRAIKEDNLTIGDTTWHFTRRQFSYGSEILFELIASDVTSEYEVTRQLMADNAELERIISELAVYNRSIDDTVKRHEILNAKMTIHDEMNRVMLAGIAAVESGDKAKLDEILDLWAHNLKLYFEDPVLIKRSGRDEITSLATLLGIELTWGEHAGDSLDSETENIVYIAAREALANAAKHAHAKHMNISFSQTKTGLTVRYTNDGACSGESIAFSGGLKNLEEIVKKKGGCLSTASEDAFTLILSVPLQK